MVDGTATTRLSQRSITTCVTAVVSGSNNLKRVPLPAVVCVSMRPPMAVTSARTTSRPTPRPASSVTTSVVLKPGLKINWQSSASVGAEPSGSNRLSMARSRMRCRSRPAPSSAMSTATSLPDCATAMVTWPTPGLPAATRSVSDSTPCTTQLRSRCSKGPIMRSSTPRSSSMAPPTMSSRTRLSASFAACLTVRYRRSEALSNSTMRVRNRSSCSSRVSRACAASWSSADCTVRCRPRCNVATSFTDSAMKRVNSCSRV